MLVGKVASIVEEKGFGFISPEKGGDDLFFHHSSFNGDFKSLQVGQPVTYAVDEKSEKPRAKTVTISGKPSPHSAAPGRSTFANKQGSRGRSSSARVPDGVFEFGFVTKLYRKANQGFISANKAGPELLFEARSVSGEKSFSRLQVGDYVCFLRDKRPVEKGKPPVAKSVSVTERELPKDNELELPRNPKARRKKPTWR